MSDQTVKFNILSQTLKVDVFQVKTTNVHKLLAGTVHVPFPFSQEDLENENSYCNHPTIKKLRERLGLDRMAGYVILMKRNVKEVKMSMSGGLDISGRTKAESNIMQDVAFDKNHELSKSLLPEDLSLLDCVFGITLFDSVLNKTICQRILSHGVLEQQK